MLVCLQGPVIFAMFSLEWRAGMHIFTCLLLVGKGEEFRLSALCWERWQQISRGFSDISPIGKNDAFDWIVYFGVKIPIFAQVYLFLSKIVQYVNCPKLGRLLYLSIWSTRWDTGVLLNNQCVLLCLLYPISNCMYICLLYFSKGV